MFYKEHLICVFFSKAIVIFVYFKFALYLRFQELRYKILYLLDQFSKHDCKKPFISTLKILYDMFKKNVAWKNVYIEVRAPQLRPGLRIRWEMTRIRIRPSRKKPDPTGNLILLYHSLVDLFECILDLAGQTTWTRPVS